jgi:transposase
VKSDQPNLSDADDERKARRLFARYAFPNRQRSCPRCGHRRLYPLRDNRRRCARCRYTFNEFAGRWLASMNFSCNEWLIFLELFSSPRSTAEIANALAIPYATAARAVSITRQALLARHAPDILAARHAPAVWGISQQQDRIIIKQLPDLHPDRAIYLPVPKSIRAGVIYTNPWQHSQDHFQTLIFRPQLQILGLANLHLSKAPLAIDRFDHFWQYARTHRLLWRQIGRTHIGLYWGEHAFRFNHRNTPLLLPLIQALTAKIPKGNP